jgi:hypothetical protein
MLNYIFEEEVQWQGEKERANEWWSLGRDKQLYRIMQALHNHILVFSVDQSFLSFLLIHW